MAGEKIEFNNIITQAVTDYMANRPDVVAALKRRVDDPTSWLISRFRESFTEQQFGKMAEIDVQIVKIVMEIVESFLTGKVYRK
jgi:hypothetical protein